MNQSDCGDRLNFHLKTKKLLGLTLKKILILIALLLLAAGSYVGEESFFTDVVVDEMTARYADATSAFVEVDGMQVHYRDTGHGDLPPLVLLHGNSSSLHTWDAWAKHFERTRRVVRLDLPGMGLTGPDPDKRYGFGALTGFLARFCDKLGLERIDLAGNSHGGRLAWAFAVKKPERVRKLVLIDSAGYPLDFRASLLAELRGMWPISVLARYFTPRFIVKYVVGLTYGDQTKVTEELVDHYMGLQLRAGNRAAFGEMMDIYKVDEIKDIRSIRTPTLILWGDKDNVIPVSDGKRFRDDIQDSKLIVYEGVGHMPMEEVPERSAADTQAFLDSAMQ